MKTLGGIFDPRANGLNAVRLGLATAVIVHHSFELSGNRVPWGPVREALHSIPVDGFFAVSGFLIVSSWVRRPRWWAFLRARLLRILPGLYACLAVTAVLLAPLGLLLGGGIPGGYVPAAAGYVADGLNLRIDDFSIGGTPTGVPVEGAWNGSLWTLFWEFLCYLGVLAAGVVGLLRWRWTIPLVFVGATVAQVAVDLGVVGGFWATYGARFGLMFAAGALVWLVQDRLPAGRGWAAGAAAVVVIALVVLLDYRAVAAFPVAYLVMWLGAVARAPRWRLRNDISYGVYIYGFPVQQVLAIAGGTRWGVTAYVVLSVLGTLPLAAASWWWVEKPALRLKQRDPRPVSVREGTVAAGAGRA